MRGLFFVYFRCVFFAQEFDPAHKNPEKRSQKSLYLKGKSKLWLLSSLGIDSPDIDIERDFAAIRENLSYLEEENSLTKKHSELINEWCSEKNGTLVLHIKNMKVFMVLFIDSERKTAM